MYTHTYTLLYMYIYIYIYAHTYLICRGCPSMLGGTEDEMSKADEAIEQQQQLQH